MKILTRDGDQVPGAVVFNNVFLRGIYPPTRPPSEATRADEEKRIGLRATLAPGKSAPLTVSWRVKQGEEQPVRVEIAGSSLDIPDE